MTSVDGGKERLVTVHDLGVGDASNLVVAVAQKQGYSVAATGPDQFRMIRQKRPMWAVVAAILTFPIFGIGLLFLLVRKTDSGTVAVFEGRDGTKVRFVGSIDDEIVESVIPRASRDAIARAEPSEENAIATKVDGPPDPMPRLRGPRDTEQSAPPTSVDKPASNSAARMAPPVSEPMTLIDSSPIAKARARSFTTVDADFEKTVARASLTPLAGGVAIELPDGRSLPISGGIVIGRSPRSPNGNTEMKEVPYQDSSLSKTHLVIESTGSGVAVTDLHSTNGTTIVEGGSSRGCPPGEAVWVALGAEIRAGDVAIRLRTSR